MQGWGGGGGVMVVFECPRRPQKNFSSSGWLQQITPPETSPWPYVRQSLDDLHLSVFLLLWWILTSFVWSKSSPVITNSRIRKAIEAARGICVTASIDLFIWPFCNRRRKEGGGRRDRLNKETRVGCDEAFPWRRQSRDRPRQRSAEGLCRSYMATLSLDFKEAGV